MCNGGCRGHVGVYRGHVDQCAGLIREGFLEEVNQEVFPSLAVPLLGPLHLLSHQTSTETWKASRIGDLGLLSITFRDSESECLGWGHGELYFKKLPG